MTKSPYHIGEALRGVRQLRHLACAALMLLTQILCAQLELPISAPVTQTAYQADASSESASRRPEPSAGQILGAMLAYLSSQPEYYAEVTCTSSLSMAGMERMNTARSRIWMRRPDHFVWTTQGDLGSSAMAADGHMCTLYLPSLLRYTEKPIEGRAGAAAQLSAMAAPYGAVAGLLLACDMTSITLETLAFDTPARLEPEIVYGIPCEHVQLSAPSGMTELWIARGGAPVPVKLASEQLLPPAAATKDMGPAHSRYEVDFRWKVSVQLPDSTFRLNLPANAMKVELLGGPNLAAMNWKPAKPGKKPAQAAAKKLAKPTESRIASLPTQPLPPMQNSSGQPALIDSDVPSLSGGTPDPFAASTPAPKAQTQSSRMPDLSLPLLQGGSVKLSSLRGRAVVLDFWATWCGPCRQAMPIVEQLSREWRARGVEFYAVNMDEDPAAVKAFAAKQGMSMPVVIDSGGALARSFGVNGIPYLVVIGRDGALKASHTGAGGTLRNDLTGAISAAAQ